MSDLPPLNSADPNPQETPHAKSSTPAEPELVPPALEDEIQMRSPDSDYDLKADAARPKGARRPRPGDPDFVPPKVIVERAKPELTAEQLDARNHTGTAVAGYIFFLFPLLIAPHSRFARYHANQSLLLLVSFIVSWAVFGGVHEILSLDFVNRLSPIIAYPLHVIWFLTGALAIIIMLTWILLSLTGIVNASNGEEKPLPLVGHFSLIKIA